MSELNNIIENLMYKYYPTDQKFIEKYALGEPGTLESVIEFYKPMHESINIVEIMDYYDDAGFMVLADEGYPEYLNLLHFFVHPKARQTMLKDEMFLEALDKATELGKALVAHCPNYNQSIIRFYNSKSKYTFQSNFRNIETTYFVFKEGV